jgi:cell division protease FtsH
MLGRIRRHLLPISVAVTACGLVCSLTGWWMTPTLIVLGAAIAAVALILNRGPRIIRTRPPQFETSTFLKIGEEERRRSAFHEAAHCVVAWFNPSALEPVQVRVAREAVGEEIPAYTAYRPGATSTESQMRASVVVFLAGAAADLVTHGERTTGYGHDLEQATATARLMVCRYAMGEGTPFRSFNPEIRDFGDETADLVSKAIVRILESARDEARRQVNERWSEIEKVAAAVMEKETLESEDILELLGPRPKKL